MPFTILRENLTRMECEAIVNPCNPLLQMDGGVSAAIAQAAGRQKLEKACRKHVPVQTGSAVITRGFDLPAKYIIHTAGPVYDPEHPSQSMEALYACYMACLQAARKKRLKSVAFPLLSSGAYGFEKNAALHTATRAMTDFLARHDMDLYLCLFDRQSFQAGSRLFSNIKSYIEEAEAEKVQRQGRSRFAFGKFGEVCSSIPRTERKCMAVEESAGLSPLFHEMDLDSRLQHAQAPFSAYLLSLIDAAGKSDAQVYKKANLDRRHFAKIRKGDGYLPKKPTILALAVSLELDLEETEELLSRAGYALSHASRFDLILEYCIEHEIYDVYEINEVLFSYNLPLLGNA